jgi:hypothetical protein
MASSPITEPAAQPSRRDRPAVSIIALIAANSVPFFGVIFFGWRVFPILLIYWIENVFVGVFNVLRMLFADPGQPLLWFAKLFMVPFFCVHYGLFTTVHGAFIFDLFGDSTVRQSHGLMPSVATVSAAVLANGVNFAVFVLFMSHFVSFVWNYFLGGEFRNVSLDVLMARPYQRVVVLHLVIIGGGAAVAALGSPLAAVAVLVGVKTTLDLAAHKRERARLAVPVVSRRFLKTSGDAVTQHRSQP